MEPMRTKATDDTIRYDIVATVRGTKPLRRDRIKVGITLTEAQAWEPSALDKRYYKYFRVAATRI